jgi:hypothetical protein
VALGRFSKRLASRRMVSRTKAASMGYSESLASARTMALKHG